MSQAEAASAAILYIWVNNELLSHFDDDKFGLLLEIQSETHFVNFSNTSIL